MNWILYHAIFVNKKDVLTTQIEEQLLASYSSPKYKHLSYSEKTGQFVFCNKVTFSSNDTAGLVDQAVKQNNLTKDEASQKTNE